MALAHGRKFIGIEISAEYLDIAKNRIAGANASALEAA
jgi:DNA modification methylase